MTNEIRNVQRITMHKKFPDQSENIISGTLLGRQVMVSFVNTQVTHFYPPLYIAGPVNSFNAFASFVIPTVTTLNYPRFPMRKQRFLLFSL